MGVFKGSQIRKLVNEENAQVSASAKQTFKNLKWLRAEYKFYGKINTSEGKESALKVNYRGLKPAASCT